MILVDLAAVDVLEDLRRRHLLQADAVVDQAAAARLLFHLLLEADQV